jgi:hypothetical protein
MISNARTLRQFRQSIQRLFGRKAVHNRRGWRLSFDRLEDRELLAASFFAPAEPSGSVNVQLVPLANVTAGTQEIVTFGVPFTRGSVSQAQLSQVRVLKDGVEVPAFVEQLTPWRSIDDAAIDGQSVRVARIQIPFTFTSLTPQSVTVQWGGPARTLNRTTLQDPRIEWHTVTSGSFVAADNVEEPDVLPVLPAAYLSKGMLDARTDPTNSSVAETRDDPAVSGAMTFTGYTEYDTAQKNFFYTIINQNPGITVPYKTDPEPWLYDRSAGMYELYLRSGFATALREAVRAADFYADHLDSSGFFTLKPGDPKYSYNESLAYTYWLLGDNRMLAPISTVVNAFSGTQTHWSPNLSFFTERNTGDKLLATEMAYEVTGNATFKSSVQTIVGDLIWHQNGAGGQLPANRIDGGLYHTGQQHDISEASSADVLIASSWMSVLVVDPMVRVFGVWQGNSQIPDFIVRMGNFEKAAAKTDANGQFGGTTRYPDYLMRADGTSDNRSDTDVQHAMDVGSVAAWATYFAELRGTPDASLRQLANDLYATYDVGVNFWTRPGGTNFNVSPPRRYTWEYKNSPSFSWALTGTDAPSQPGTLQFSGANYTVNENQGTATITVTRTNGSAGSVSVNYATSDGSATAGSDYTATSGTLTLGDGVTSKTFTVPIINDTAVENAETLTLTLSSPTGGAALSSPATATLTINSDDTTNQPITNTYQQGVNGYTGTTDADFSNQYGDNGATTTNGDQLGVYQTTGTGAYSIEGLIRFDNLGITSNSLTHANVTGATLTLSVDTFSANPTIRGYYVAAPWTTAAGTDLGWLRTGAGQNWAVPGAGGQGTDVVAGKSFVLSGITGNGTQSITVNLDPVVVQTWIDNPAANQGILLVNETTGAIVRVNASENATAAARPKLGVTYTVGPATSQPGVLQFSNATYSVNENGGTATITVTRTNGSTGSVSVNYATSNGTATAGSDYTASSGTLTLGDGVTSKTFTVPITDDTAFEGNETVNLTLSSPTGGATLGSPAAATLTIVDNDSPPPVNKFTDVTALSGVGAIVSQMYQTNPDWWLSGEHLVDLDNDGHLDLFLDSHGGGNAIVALNDGHGVFTRVTTGTWPSTEVHEMFDINNDGKVDLNATYQDGGSQWWINNSTPGNVNFTPTAVTRDGNTSRSQVLMDFNGDGKVDWLRSAPPGLVIDFGDGAGGFTQGSRTYTIAGTDSNNNASFLPADFDGDGKIDLLILTGGNYDGTPGKTALWHNNGNGTFTDVTASSGLPANGTMAKGVGDFDQDGDVDIIATENKTMPPVIYMNDGHGVFTKKAGAITGVAAGSLDYSFWGTAVTTDIDNDGIADIIMNGKYYLKVLRGTGGGNFTYMNTAWGINDTSAASVDDGLTFGDFNGDGRLDIIGYNETFPSRTLNVYRNDLPAQNWLNVRPVGLAGNKGAAGATISVYAAGTNQLLWREQVAQYDFQVATSYYGPSETERHYGLGSRSNVDVVVQFANAGHVTRMNNVAANQTIRVLESASGGAPTVTVNDGTAQRSRVTQLTVAFPGLATLPANPVAAFRLTRLGPGGPTGDVTLAVDLSGSTATQTVVKLTFSGALTEFGSLVDGNYTLTVLGSQVTVNGAPLDGDGDGTPGGDSVTPLYRLFGDVTGDRVVDASDLAFLRSAFGSVQGNPGFIAALDLNGDGVINVADLSAFRSRFGSVV